MICFEDRSSSFQTASDEPDAELFSTEIHDVCENAFDSVPTLGRFSSCRWQFQGRSIRQLTVAYKRVWETVLPSFAHRAAESDVILSSLKNDAAVGSVYLEGGVFSKATPGTIILEMSTISPERSRRIYQEARTAGVKFLDVANSGSTPVVDAGMITLLAVDTPVLETGDNYT
jgi:hypothetical protein